MSEARQNPRTPLNLYRDIDYKVEPVWVRSSDAARADVEAFIKVRFAALHDATIRHFMPSLLTLRDAEGVMLAVAGARAAGEETLFLERYLDEPIEHALARVLHTTVERDRVVEVGNLAVAGPGHARLMIIAMTRQLARAGFEWVVFTGGTSLFNSFRRLGLMPRRVAPADPSRLGEECQWWGHYYDDTPFVHVGHIRQGLELLNGNGRLELRRSHHAA
ncbi:thermostable hemolysin [Kushneria phosphatilytica]|uniref:Thermostable hemolysin n=1 Tax=Kushneria phosphatilytica TaxID=657387 RepID=A0A5C0ZX59_9GAMM|nr:thermostable hemolysin [Kushneria phosphatilytica]QEL10486.1 thermostable hemolysin [Kushneria phosphatilytica]